MATLTVSTVTRSTNLRDHLAKALIDWEDDTILVALLSDAYTANAAHEFFSEVEAYEVSGTGYTAGGATLAGRTVVNGEFRASDLTWSALTVSNVLHFVSTSQPARLPLAVSSRPSR